MAGVLVVNLSRYTGKIHLPSCSRLRQTARRTLPAPESLRITLAKCCRPTIQDALEAAADIEWDHRNRGGDALNNLTPLLLEHAEKKVARRQEGYGRTFTAEVPY